MEQTNFSIIINAMDYRCGGWILPIMYIGIKTQVFISFTVQVYSNEHFLYGYIDYNSHQRQPY